MREGTENPSWGMDPNGLPGDIIGAAIEVHRILGPGLLESIYEGSLCHELNLRGIPFQRQVSIPVSCKGVDLDGCLRLDLLVAGQIIVEVKAVESLLPVHEAQLPSYLNITGLRLGLLMDFHTLTLKQGLKRLPNGPAPA